MYIYMCIYMYINMYNYVHSEKFETITKMELPCPARFVL